ncbi:MAG: TonB family protein, partial [Flavobacteriales bacterium]|nr:TonB family protein [Flavobacteriales bacterium]
MADKQHNDIFPDTDCLSMKVMELYAGEKLSDAERQTVEKHLVDCAICSDALEGLTLAGFSSDVDDRIASLNERISAATEETSAGFWKREYYAYAAGFIGIMIISGLLLNYLKTSDVTDPQFISQEILLEEKMLEKNIPAASEPRDTTGAKDATVASGERLDDQIRVEGKIVTAADSDDEDLSRNKEQEGENFKYRTVLTEAGAGWTDELKEETEVEVAESESTVDHLSFATGSSSVSAPEEQKLAGKNELDNRRDAGIDAFASQLKGEDKRKQDYGGLSDYDVSGISAGNAPGDADKLERYYKAKEKAKNEDAAPAKTNEVVQSEEQPAREITTITSSSTSFELGKSVEPVNDSKSSGAPKAAVSKEVAQSRKTSKNGDIASGKKMESAKAKTGEEARTSANEASLAKAEQELPLKAEQEPRVRAPEYDDPNTLMNAILLPESAKADSISIITLDQGPMFLGGKQNLQQYLEDNMVYPDSAKELGINCKVQVSFTVNADSTITDAEVVKPIGGGCDEEALRVVNKMPNWVPAQSKGKRVARQYNLELDFESIK